MEAIRLFYAWQSDHPNWACRGLIRRALQSVASQLSRELQVDAAPRPIPIQVDSDTRGVPGSPSVADTIFSKIEECDVFVADLTLTQSDHRPAPNPNVLIEYGFALHAIGAERVVGVMNTAFGGAEKLPFDIQHRRWPCRYSVDLGADHPQRAAAERDLVESLRVAIGEIVKGRGTEPDVGAADPGGVLEPRNLWLEPVRMVRNDGETRVTLRESHPSITLEVAPALPRPRPMTNSEMNRFARRLFPLGFDGGDFAARFADGIVRYASLGTGEGIAVAIVASALTTDGRLHGIDRETLRPTGIEEGIVPTVAVEDVLLSGLGTFLAVAAEIGLDPPLQVWVKLEGVLDYKLGVDRERFVQSQIGQLLVAEVSQSFQVHSFDQRADELLLPFFEEIYDKAGGYERPHRPLS